MELTFNGHACLTLTDSRGRVVVTDPYRSGALGGRIAFAPVRADADFVTVSHYHVDHGHVTDDLGAPQVVDRDALIDGIPFTVRPTFHDRVGGARMGMTSMIATELDGLRVAHLGDIGCDLTPEDAAALGPIDILIWPVGGIYTLGPEDAAQVLAILKPRVAIPVHFEHARCTLGMAPIDATIATLATLGTLADSTASGGRGHTLVRSGTSHWSAADGLPSPGVTQIQVLEPAL